MVLLFTVNNLVYLNEHRRKVSIVIKSILLLDITTMILVYQVGAQALNLFLKVVKALILH